MKQFFKLRVRGLLFILLSLQAHYGYSQDFDCNTECFGDFDFVVLESEPNCQIILNTLNCYEDHMEECYQQSIALAWFYHDAIDLSERHGCEDTVTVNLEMNSTSSSNTGTPPPPVNCPSVPGILVGGSSEMGSMPDFVSANVFPSVQPRGCTMYNPNDLQHCSMFAYSHLRAFGGYRRGLETCSIPGAWDLFRHSAFSVQVDGELEDVNSNHTKLTKINITFYQTDCLEETKSYVVDYQYALPRTFTDQTIPHPQNSSLLLNTDENGTVATILAIWINATIVIRRHAGLLSVTLQVPGMLSFQSDGLCTGCPPHAYVNITQFHHSVQGVCADETTTVNTNCFRRAGVTNQNAFNGIVNNTYLDTCVYSLFKGGSVGVLELFNRIASDAKLLPSDRNVPPRPSPPDPPVVVDPDPPVSEPVSNTTSPSTTSLPVRETRRQTTSDFFSSAKPQTFLALHSNLVTTILIVCISIFLTR